MPFGSIPRSYFTKSRRSGYTSYRPPSNRRYARSRRSYGPGKTQYLSGRQTAVGKAGKLNQNLKTAIGLPQSLTVKLRTCHFVTIANDRSNLTWDLNSAFAPYPVLGTVQPYLYTELSKLYSAYYVTNTHVTIQAHNTEGIIGHFIFNIHGDATHATRFTLARAQGIPTMCMGGGSSLETANSINTYKRNVNIARVLGVKPLTANDSAFTALVNAGPVTKCRMDISVDNETGTTFACEFWVTLDQTITFINKSQNPAT